MSRGAEEQRAEEQQAWTPSQPQRGCIHQPRVAVLGYPGATSARVSLHYSVATQRGCVQTTGLRYSALPGSNAD
jgi:hypothetical protein